MERSPYLEGVLARALAGGQPKARTAKAPSPARRGHTAKVSKEWTFTAPDGREYPARTITCTCGWSKERINFVPRNPNVDLEARAVRLAAGHERGEY